MSEWRGIPREEIPWFPTIDAEKCIGCRECVNFCRNNVLAFDEVAGKTVVVNRYNCVVECRTCARLCPADAISFPDEAEFTRFVKTKLAEAKSSFTEYTACKEYVDDHHKKMEERAKEKGITTPMVKRNPCDALKARGVLK